MKRLKVIALFGMVLLGGLSAAEPPAFAEQSMRIAAVVNEDAVTQTEVDDRLRMILSSSGLPNTAEFRQKALPQVLNSLIEERLMMQEAARNAITVSDEEVMAGFQEIAKQNNFTLQQFEEVMRRGGISKKTLTDQIRAQLSWNKVIQSVLRPRVDVSDSDVDVRIERLRSNVGRKEFLVAEIFLPVDSAAKEEDIRKLAQQLAADLRSKKAPFPAVAAQFSRAPGADKGGSLGWVQAGQLSEELDAVLNTMAQGDVSEAVRTPAGFHILQLNNSRVIEERIIPGRGAIINQIGLERLDRLQRRTLMDLKAEAFIERRV